MTSPPARVDAVVLAWLAEPLLRLRRGPARLGEGQWVTLVDNGAPPTTWRSCSRLPACRYSDRAAISVSRRLQRGAALWSGAIRRADQRRLDRRAGHDRPPGRRTRARPDVGIAAGAVRLADDPSRLNSSGNIVHVLGLSWVAASASRRPAAGRPTPPAPWARAWSYPERTGTGSAASTSLLRLPRGRGTLDPDVAAGPARGQRAGRHRVHRYEFSRNPLKFYLVERNRLMFVSTCGAPGHCWCSRRRCWRSRWAWTLLALRQGWLKREGARLGLAVAEPARACGRAAGWSSRRRTVPDRVWMRVLADTLDTPLITAGRRPRTAERAMRRTGGRLAPGLTGRHHPCSLTRAASRCRSRNGTRLLGESRCDRTIERG